MNADSNNIIDPRRAVREAIARLKERRHRQAVMYLNSLPAELKKDIGWTGEYRRYE